jgi:hypothetical protein
MYNSLKIIKILLYSYSVLHVSGTLAPIIRSLLILHIQPPVIVCGWVGCIFQLWSVTTVAFATVVTVSSKVWKTSTDLQSDSVINKGNSISKLQIRVATYVFELSAGNCHH